MAVDSIPKAIGYIDGLNFYENSKDQDWYPYGWCDWRATIQNYCPGSVPHVKYFTSMYAGHDGEVVRRQDLHLRAMREIAGAEIIVGHTRRRELKCQRCKTPLTCHVCGASERFNEKLTDVKLALAILEDGIYRDFDRGFLVTTDVDILPAVEAVLRCNDKAIVTLLYPPVPSIAEDFHELALRSKRFGCMRLDLARMQRFPETLPKGWGTLPEHWRIGAGKRKVSSQRRMPLPRRQQLD